MLHNLLVGLIVAFCLTACNEQILHDLSEQDANKVLSRLSRERVGAKKILQSDGRWAISVSKDATAEALSFLDTNRVLSPRVASATSGGKGGIVPSREEQWFRYERSVSMSIEESLGSVAGVLEARVHLHLPETDPLFGTRKENIGSGSVLLVVDGRYGSKDEEIATLVAGAAGIPAGRVTVLRSVARPHPSDEGDTREAGGTLDETAGQPERVASTRDFQAHNVSQAEVGIAFFGAVTLCGAGAIFFRNRRRRVRFVLPGSSDDGI